MAEINDNKKKFPSKVGATATGAGSGTLLVIIAESLPETNPLKSWLVIVAPTLSVTLSALWYWAQIEIANYLQEKKIYTLVQKTKKTLLVALNNSDTSNEHREAIRRKLEELELIVSDQQMKKIRSLAPATERTSPNNT